MSSKRRKTKLGEYSRNDQLRVMTGVTLLLALCVALIALMAVVNHLPIGNRYTYTEASDMWILEDGEMAIAAPEVVLFSDEPTVAPTQVPSPTPTVEPEPTEAPEPMPTVEPVALLGTDVDADAASDSEAEDASEDVEGAIEEDTDFNDFTSTEL